MTTALVADAVGLADRLTALRRAIHAEPELGLHTPKTRDKVRAALAHLPLDWREGPSTTGLVATLKGGAGAGRTVLLRGDMDALPMPEETGLDFASTIPGTMHACGHDAHVAMLAGAAELLCARASQLTGEVRFMFQPGEEGYHGARFMLDDGLLGGGDDGVALPDAAFALHVMPNAPHGLIGGRTGALLASADQIGTLVTGRGDENSDLVGRGQQRAGALLASADQIGILVTGRGGHASMPHATLDPMPVACEIVTALQAMVTRKFSVFDPVVATISKIECGTAHNVIADTARLTGTMRSLSAANRARLREEVQLLAAGIAGAHGLTAEVTIQEGFPVTVCDASAVALGEHVAHDLFGAPGFLRLPDPIMGAEDFAYVLEKVPGAMFFLGVSHEGADWQHCCGIHSTRMQVDESTMPLGAAFLAGVATRFLAEGFA